MLRLAYADPPYPGCAHLYPEKTEVDHADLIARLREYDGWALSTNENALRDVLALCPAGVRVLAWCKPNAPPFFDHPTRSWEPVLCVPGRDDAPTVRVRSYLEAAAPTGVVNGGRAFVGQKPQVFGEWLFRCLGAQPSDTLDDLYPGTGAIGRAWEAWQAQGSFVWTPAQEPRVAVRQRLAREQEAALF